MLKLKLQYFDHLIQRADSLEKILMLGRIEGGGEGGDERGRDGWMVSSTQWTWVWTNSGRQWITGKPGVLHSMGSQKVGHNWATEQQQQKKTFLSTRVSHLLLRIFEDRLYYFLEQDIFLVKKQEVIHFPLRFTLSLQRSWGSNSCSESKSMAAKPPTERQHTQNG